MIPIGQYVDDDKLTHTCYVDEAGNRFWQPAVAAADLNFANMLVDRNPPRCMTDDVFLAGLPQIDEQQGRNMPQFKKRMAEQGVTLTGSEHYIPALARHFADPRALVSHGQGRGHINKICEADGLECHGAVERDGAEPVEDPFTPKTKLHKNILARKKKQYRATDPEGTAKMSDGELTEMIVAKHGSKK